VSICEKDYSSETHGHHPFNDIIAAYPGKDHQVPNNIPISRNNRSESMSQSLTNFLCLRPSLPPSLPPCADMARTVTDYWIHTNQSPQEEDYKIVFDFSLFENGSVLSNGTQGLPCPAGISSGNATLTATRTSMIDTLHVVIIIIIVLLSSDRGTYQSYGCDDFLNCREMYKDSFEK